MSFTRMNSEEAREKGPPQARPDFLDRALPAGAAKLVVPGASVPGTPRKTARFSRVSFGKDSEPDVDIDSPWSAGRGRPGHGGHLHHAATAPVDQRYEALFAENEVLVERIQELEEENERLLAVAKELSDLREQDDGMDMRAVLTSGQTKKCLEHLEWQLLQEEQRRDDAQRTAKAEEDAKEQLLQQLSVCREKQKETESDCARLRSRLSEAELKAKTALKELQVVRASRDEVHLTLEAERRLLSEEREKCRTFEDEIEEMRASKACAEVAYGRRTRSKKRFVTDNLMSQLGSFSEAGEEAVLEQADEQEVAEEGEDVPSSPTVPELSGSSNELLEDLRQQLSTALRSKDDAIGEAKAARTLFQDFQREHAKASQEADLREAAHAKLEQRIAQLERALELERKDNKELRVLANTPWWGRLSCCSRSLPGSAGKPSFSAEPLQSAAPPIDLQDSCPKE